MSAFDIDDVPNWRGRDVIDQNGHPAGVIADIYSADEEARLFQHYGLDVPATDRVDAEAPTAGRRLRRHGVTE